MRYELKKGGTLASRLFYCAYFCGFLWLFNVKNLYQLAPEVWLRKIVQKRQNHWRKYKGSGNDRIIGGRIMGERSRNDRIIYGRIIGGDVKGAETILSTLSQNDSAENDSVNSLRK